MIYVLYHAGCCDGYASAFAAWLIHGESARYLPVRYQEPFPALEGASPGQPAEVLIVDFSYPPAELLAVADRPDVHRITVLDHHAPAAEALLAMAPHPKIEIHFDGDKSGAVLTWEYLHPAEPVPELFLFVQDYDLAAFKLKETRQIHAAIWRGTKRKFEEWATLLTYWKDGDRSRSVVAGTAIIQADDQNLYILEKGAVPITGPNGEPGLSVNTGTLLNEVAQRLLDTRPDIQFVMVWNDSGGFRRVSLRSRKDGCDVEAMAKLRGGGGHRAASGYRYPCPAPDWTP